MNTSATSPSDGLVLCRLATQPHLAAPLGRLTLLRDLMQLYGHMLAAAPDERTGVARVFAQLVMQQQELITVLERAGLRIDMRRANQAPPDAPPELVFRLAGYEVLREEIAAVQAAKVDGRLVAHALQVQQRLSDLIASTLASTPDIPIPAQGWAPGRRDVRRPLKEVTSYVLAYAGVGEHREAAVVAMGVDALQEISSASAAETTAH